MKAAMIQSPGVVKVVETDTPEPGPGEVLLKVNACALCGTDQRVLRGEKHIDVPIIGHEIVGTVEALGEGVDNVEVGKRYAVETVIGCGSCPMCAIHQENLCENTFKAIGYAWNGGFAEYMVMPAQGVKQGCLIPMPDNMSDAVGTMLEPISCCVNGLRCMPLEDMQHAVIFGAGVIGTLNGLVCKARGVDCVTIMNRSQPRLDVIQSLGLPFEHLVNMTENDPVEWVKAHTDGRGVGAVVVSASVKSLVPLGMNMLRWGGHLSIFAGMNKQDPIEPIDLNLIHYPEQHIHGANSSVLKDYQDAVELLESGRIDGQALVTHEFKLDEFEEAIRVQTDPTEPTMKIIIYP